jgi:hypothetical protein
MPPRFNVFHHIEPHAIRSMADTHPRLRHLADVLVEKHGLNRERAKHFVERLVTVVLNDFGKTYTGEMSARLDGIVKLREKVTGIYESTINGKGLPDGVTPSAVEGMFRELQNQMNDLHSPTRAAEEGRLPHSDDIMTQMATTPSPDVSPPPAHPLSGLDNAEIDRAVDDISSPAITRGRRPQIERRRVPTRQRDRLDLHDLVIRPGERPSQALQRVRQVIGKTVSETPLHDAWEAARSKVLGDRPLSSITREEMLGTQNRKGLYDLVRDTFWKEVRERANAKHFLEESGFVLGNEPAPLLEVNSPDIPIQERRISLDHIAEKAQGDNWTRALDADNLELTFHNPNSFREIVQRRHRLRE